MNQKNDNLNDAIIRLCDNSFNSMQKINIDIINFYKLTYKSLLLDLKYLENNEPMKIFKKKHEEWEKEYNDKLIEINEVLKKIEEEVKEGIF
ncbi:MAG: hypothetical protein IJD92_03630 [Bacilli bacterium]|nr:hypothetical protein [Bacilli bacterium]